MFAVYDHATNRFIESEAPPPAPDARRLTMAERSAMGRAWEDYVADKLRDLLVGCTVENLNDSRGNNPDHDLRMAMPCGRTAFVQAKCSTQKGRLPLGRKYNAGIPPDGQLLHMLGDGYVVTTDWQGRVFVVPAPAARQMIVDFYAAHVRRHSRKPNWQPAKFYTCELLFGMAPDAGIDLDQYRDAWHLFAHAPTLDVAG